MATVSSSVVLSRNDPAAWWSSQIKKGLAFRKKYASEVRWRDIGSWYEHRWSNPRVPNFNLVYMLASSLVPALVFQAPHVVNTPRRGEFSYWAAFFDGVDNWCFDSMQMKSVTEEAVLQAFLYNHVGFELGFDYPTEEMKRTDEILFNDIPNCIDRTRKTNLPWVDLIHPSKLILAPGTKSLNNCRWYAKFGTLPVRVLKELPDVVNAKATHRVRPSALPDEIAKSEGNKWSTEEPEHYCCFWQIHDAETKKYLWLSTDNQIIIPPKEDPLQVDGLPLELLTFNKGVNSIYGTPDSLYIETQLLEGNECRRDGRLQRRNALTKGFYDNQLLTPEDIEKFLEGDPMVMIPVQLGGDKKLPDVLQLTTPHVQIEYFEYQKQLLNDAQLLTGTGPNQFGTFAPGRRTKYETQVVEERNLLRTGARRQSVGELLGSFASRMNQLLIREWKGYHIQRVLGRDAAMYYVRALPSDFYESRMNLVSSVNVESMAPTSRERRREEMLEVLKILSQFQGIDPLPILNRFLSSFEWSQMYNSLPVGNQGQVMNLNEFQSQQQGLLSNPQQLGGMAANNLRQLMPAVNSLPSAPPAANMG